MSWNCHPALLLLAGVVMVGCSSVIVGWWTCKTVHTSPDREAEIYPTKATYEHHRYLVFRWNVIHDPNCECRRLFNHKSSKEAEK